MKKIALLLAALLVLGMLAGCNTAEEDQGPAHVINGYDINIYDDGWKEVEQIDYDMQLVKDGVTMSMIGFTSMDFVDIPPAEDLYVDANEDMLEDKSAVVAAEAETSYEKNGKQYISTLFSAKDGETNMQYYCFMVTFNDEAGSMAWICFSATTEVMKQQKDNLKKLVESMDANGKYYTQEELDQQVQDALGEDGYAEDSGETIGETGYVGEDFPVTTLPEDTEPAEEETKPADDAPDATGETVTGETTPAEEPTEATE